MRVQIDKYMTQNVARGKQYTTTKDVYKAECQRFAHHLQVKGCGRNMSPDRLLGHAKEYVAWMGREGYSSHSIHTTISALAKGLNVKMADIGAVQRKISSKGRGESAGYRGSNNEDICRFAAAVGIRRQEYANLRGGDFWEKDGRAFVIVRKGKGGKYQEQLIRPDKVDEVRDFFRGAGKDEKLFPHAEQQLAHANVHALRRDNAQEMYRRYSSMSREERAPLMEIVRERFRANPVKEERQSWHKIERQLTRPVYVRNPELREQLQQNGFKLPLDREALLMVSVLHLSHYRVDVCYTNYLR